MRPRLMKPKVEEQWKALNCDALLTLKGVRGAGLASVSLKRQGLTDCSRRYLLQHVDWVQLGNLFKMSALEVQSVSSHLASYHQDKRSLM
jgi:hypothetical protein